MVATFKKNNKNKPVFISDFVSGKGTKKEKRM